MNLITPPEIADGGYWYAVEAVIDAVEGGTTPGQIPGVGWCAWYENSVALVRTPVPVAGFQTVPKPAGFVSIGKPFGRIGGV